MSYKYLLAIDVGTSSLKCFIADMHGEQRSLCRRDMSYRSTPDAGLLGRDFDPDLLWQTVCELITETTHRASIKTSDIAGVCATSQREGIVLLDSEGRELYGGPNIDLRATMEGIAIDNSHAQSVHRLTGHLPSLLFAPARIKWFEHNRPDIFERIRTVLAISDWINYRLTGELTSEVCSATEIGLIDITNRTWSEELIDILELPAGIYPPLAPAGSITGKVTGQAADNTGIAEGTLVIKGVPDTHCGLLGMGIGTPAEAGIVTGWSIPVQMVTDRPVIEPEGKIWCSCHVYPDRWILESNCGEAGNAFSWLMKNVFMHDGISPQFAYDTMDREAMSVPPGAEGVIASLGPGAMDMTHLHMNFGGIFLPLPLSITNIGRGHLARAVLENICFAIKANLQQLEETAGLELRKTVVGGNITGSRCFRQIVANVLGRPVYLASEKEISSLGAAILAAAGSGMYSSVSEAVDAMHSESDLVEPETLVSAEYDEYYEQWLDTLNKSNDLQEM